MASATSATLMSLKTVEWMWQSNSDPWSKNGTPVWERYSDLENIIIEEAFSTKRENVVLDHCYIDFNSRMQISKTDSQRQIRVKRAMRRREENQVREERFMDLPVVLDRSFVGQYGFVSPFVLEVRRHLKLELDDLPSEKSQLIPFIVERAAQGFVVEGRHIGKQCEAEKLASLLLKEMKSNMEEVWQCCAYLYSLESFLYKALNAAMQLVGSNDKNDEDIWRSKVPTLGPFCLLLWDDPFNARARTDLKLYRGANLTPQQIAKYEAMTKNEDEYGSLQGFSSCSRSREKVESFGNVLFIMIVHLVSIADLSAWSKYPDEEEALIKPGVCFRVLKVEHDRKRSKHTIDLGLRQRGEDTPLQTGNQHHNVSQSDQTIIQTMLGYNSKNIYEFDPQYICKLCFRILREPIQLTCGHRQCRACAVARLHDGKLKCPECSSETHQTGISPDRGFKNDMKGLQIHCVHCQWKGALKDIETHFVHAHRNSSCQYCGRTFDSIDDLEWHQARDCHEITMPCPLRNYGCLALVRRANRKEHYTGVQHQTAILTFLRPRIPNSAVDWDSKVLRMDTDGSPLLATSTFDSIRIQLQEVYEINDVLTDGVRALREDKQRLHSEMSRIRHTAENLNKEFSTVQSSVQGQNDSLNILKTNLSILDQEVSTLQQNVKDPQSNSHDGIHTWKIPGFKQKMADAQAERQASTYSTPFYTSPTGYKIRGRLYPYGYGDARGTHMSLFIALMRGEYDPILNFPFNYQIVFCLLDQSPAQNHIVHSFHPDPKSKHFQRPSLEMNTEDGLLQFASLRLLENEKNLYVHDDTIFIKIIVDFMGIPKASLSLVFSVSPGMPSTVHHKIIKEEIQRQVV